VWASAVRPRVYVPARELISREPLCSLTDQTTTAHYAPSTRVGGTCVRLGRSRGRIKANLHGTPFGDHSWSGLGRKNGSCEACVPVRRKLRIKR